MKTLHQRCALGAAYVGVVMLATVVALGPKDSSSATVPSMSYEDLRATTLLAGGGKGLDRGILEFWSVDPQPQAWLYAEDSTIDGDGVEYLIFTSGFVHPSPSNDDLDLTLSYVDGVEPADLQAALAFIVANYPHVSAPGELSVHARAVSSVQ